MVNLDISGEKVPMRVDSKKKGDTYEITIAFEESKDVKLFNNRSDEEENMFTIQLDSKYFHVKRESFSKFHKKVVDYEGRVNNNIITLEVTVEE